jgi:hypothetical protein
MTEALTCWSSQNRRQPLRSAQDVARLYADASCQRLTRRLIRYFQSRKDCLLSGDDTILDNVWDEVCVQVQDEASFYWDAYEETMLMVLQSYVEELSDYEQFAIWLQTDDGWSWQWDVDNDPEEIEGTAPDFLLDDLTHYILRHYVYPEAGKWSNLRIKSYIETHSYST